MKPSKTILLFIVGTIVLVIITGAIVWLSKSVGKIDEVSYEVVDELSRGKYFIVDWYNEVAKGTNYLKVFNNEIQIGSYSLTYENRRIRAVYPRGERFFQFYNVSHIEFSQKNGGVYCTLDYDKDGKYVFRVD